MPSEAQDHTAKSGTPEPLRLTFPDLPRLELDQLLGQLVERAQEVLATQGRLRGLLRASQLVGADLTLPAVLRRIVEAARELVGARYAALGVISPAGDLAEFVHSGMADEDVARIGHLPQGKGLLGALIEAPEPILLRRITDDPRSSGFPEGHPPMHSFLGVPIRIRNEVFGNLYLTESSNGQFSSEDEELVEALAATAAVAIDNARLYASARTQGRWLQASAAITRRLLAADVGASRPLELVGELCRSTADADLVTVLFPAEDYEPTGDLRVEVAMGLGSEGMPGLRVPCKGSLSGQVFTSGRPLRSDRSDAQDPPVVAVDFEVGPILLVPLTGSDRVRGVLTAARLRGRPPFTAGDEEMAGSFANQAAVAIELAEGRAEQQRAAMLEERDRIAADLHDHVIQRLFGAGLTLQSLAAHLGPGRAGDRLAATIDELDQVIGQIRSTIFQLNRVGGGPRDSLRSQLLEVIADASTALGFAPEIRFSGSAQDTLPAELVDDLVAVLREALANVARHARAAAAEVDLTITGDRLMLDVRDDGIGVGSPTRSSGLANIRRRAERHGGTVSLTGRQPSGTHLCWSVPLT